MVEKSVFTQSRAGANDVGRWQFRYRGLHFYPPWFSFGPLDRQAPFMKSLAVLLMMFACFSVSAADDIADAKAAFETLIKYQKNDDIRSLDLFAKHCLITFKIIDGEEEKTVVVPPEVFRETLRKEIEQKHGNKDEYKDVEFSRDGYLIKVAANIHYANSGKIGPFVALYGRDNNGDMKIEEFKITVFNNAHAQ